ncbi:MAG: isoprenylcysteine carboxyl methyltransferase [Bacteroidetes bacterium]|nr:MAG: isoprenylcysteine carboxyl methyltransferase [Bacteroidota bacterium]
MGTNKNLTGGQIIFSILYLLFWPFLFLRLSGDWKWTEGWMFVAWLLLTCAAVMIYLYVKDPALMVERFRKPGTGNQKSWDRVVLSGVVLLYAIWILIIPLDSKRYGWTTHFPNSLRNVGGIFLLLSSFFLFRSFTDNTFLSPLVRVQEERKQKLVTTGVYSFVRHPMYLGALFMFLGVPLLTGSYFGIGVGMLAVILLAARAMGEEKMLEKEFEEYAAYKQKVRCRMVPFLW